MARYEKDEINFHVFLAAMRKMHNVTLRSLSEGLCCESEMERIEKGERLPDKFMRDRILGRMGISGENYVEYLKPKEYEKWCLQNEIIKSIEDHNFYGVEGKIEEYKKFKKQSAIEKQFLCAMQLWLYKQTGVCVEEKQKLVEEAIGFTVPRKRMDFPDDMLLSIQELYLFIEYINLKQCESKEEFSRKKEQYEKILVHINRAKMDSISKTKIYSKLAYHYCTFILHGEQGWGEYQHGLSVCNYAIEMLRRGEKLYYMVELLTLKELFMKGLLEYINCGIHLGNVKKLKELIDETRKWRELVTKIYEENGISVYMKHDCHLYYSAKCYAIGDVIKKRRCMMNMSRDELCEGICSRRTLMRIELKQVESQIPIVRLLFERLGLCTEYIRARVISCDCEVLQMAESLAKYINNHDRENGKCILEKLEKKLNMNIFYNRQEVMRQSAILELETGQIELSTFNEKMVNALGYSLSLDNEVLTSNGYMTDEEITCVLNLAIYNKGKVADYYMCLLHNVCKQFNEAKVVRENISIYELLMTEIANYLGNNRDYETSNKVSNDVIKNCLQYRRANLIAQNLYNKVWNYQQIKKENHATQNPVLEKVELEKCALWAKMIYATRFYDFYIQKFNEIQE